MSFVYKRFSYFFYNNDLTVIPNSRQELLTIIRPKSAMNDKEIAFVHHFLFK